MNLLKSIYSQEKLLGNQGMRTRETLGLEIIGNWGQESMKRCNFVISKSPGGRGKDKKECGWLWYDLKYGLHLRAPQLGHKSLVKGPRGDVDSQAFPFPHLHGQSSFQAPKCHPLTNTQVLGANAWVPT